jgi:hypothetical protein
MYRRTLVASWASPPGGLAADETIEDIFAGGSGFQSVAPPTPRGHAHSRSQSHHHSRSGLGNDGTESTSGSGSGSGPGSGDGLRGTARRLPREDSGEASGDEGDGAAGGGTIRPRDMRSYRHHARRRSREKGGSSGTITMTPIDGGMRSPRGLGITSTGTGGVDGPDYRLPVSPRLGSASGREETITMTPRRRAESVASGTTLGSSDRGKDGFKRSREVQEGEVRDDMVAWQLPGAVA